MTRRAPASRTWATRAIGYDQLGWALLFAIAWTVLAVTFGYVLGGVNYRSILLTINAALIFWPLIGLSLQNRFDLFEPIISADFALFGMFIGRPIADIFTGHFHEHGYDIHATWDEALLMVVVVNLVFQMSYFSGVGPWLTSKLRPVSRDFQPNLVIGWALFVSAMGLLLFSIFLASQGGLLFLLTMITGRHSSSSGDLFATQTAYFYNGAYFLAPGSCMLFGAWLKERKWWILLLTAIVCVPFMIFTLGGGTRSGVIGVLCGLPLMWYQFHSKRPKLLPLLTALVCIAVFFSFIRDNRVVEAVTPKKSVSYVDDPLQGVTDLFTSDDDEMFDVMAQEISVMPEWVRYRPFGVITDVVVRAVPRGLWPSKPPSMGDTYYATMEPYRFRYSRGGTATSIFGDFYLDSGWITVILWTFALGATLRFVWLWFLKSSESMIFLMVYSTVPGAIINTFRGSLAAYLGLAFFSTFPLVLLAFVHRVRLREKP